MPMKKKPATKRASRKVVKKTAAKSRASSSASSTRKKAGTTTARSKPVKKAAKKKVAKPVKKKVAKAVKKTASKATKKAKALKTTRPTKKAKATSTAKASKKTARPATKSKAVKKKAATKAKSSVAAKPKSTRKPLPKPVGGKVLARHPVVATSRSKKKGVTKITAADKKEFRKMLLKMRERITRQIDALKGESLHRSEKMVTAEDGTDVFDRQFALTLVSTEQESLHDIDDALRRLDSGLYGVCEDCGEKIEKPRLKALPFVRSCIECQSAKERNRPRYIAMR